MPSDREPDGPGLTPLELLALSPLQRLIVRLLLRAGELSHQALAGAVGEQGVNKGSETFEAALRYLCEQQWISPGAGPAGPTYRVNVRQRTPNRGRGEIWRRLGLGGEQEEGR